MRNFLFTAFILIIQPSVAQTITQLRTFPANPTIADTIYLIADLQFRSTACELDHKSISVSGNSIVASTQHCVGIATAICNSSDTFILGSLAAGRYTVDLSLSSGNAPVPCSPGIIPSDTDTMSFVVQSALGIDDVDLRSYTVYPNPAGDYIVLSDAYRQMARSVKIISVTGAVVLEIESITDQIDISDLAPGVYSIEIFHSNGSIVEKFMKE